MNKATLTLELTYQQIAAVMNFLHSTPEESFKVPTRPKLPPKVQLPSEDLTELVEPPRAVKVKPTASPRGSKLKPAMPSFGRAQSQIDEYESSEKARIELLDAKEKLRDIKRVEKEALTAKQEKEVKDIKAQIPTVPIVRPAKPWAL